MNAPVTYTKFIPSEYAIELFDRMWNELDWIRHDKVPRREYYVNDIGVPYTYGQKEFARTYLPQPIHEAIQAIKWMVEDRLEVPMEVCFLNGYEDGSDQLGWHADDSPEMDDNRPIAIVSLYPKEHFEREIWFRPRPRREESGKAVAGPVEKLRLGNGSLAIMAPGMQDTHQHRIPKSDRQNCGPRISLTFRGYVDGNLG